MSNYFVTNILLKKAYIFILPFIIWTMIPIFSYNTYARIVVLISIALFVFIRLLLKFSNNNLSLNKVSFIAFFFLIYVWFINSIFSSNDYFLSYLHLTIFFIVIIMAIDVAKSSMSKPKIIIYTILITNFITAYITIVGLSDDYNIARHLSSSNDLSRSLAGQGFGGYGFIYLNVILLPIFFIYLKELIKTKSSDYLLIVTLILNILAAMLLIFKAQYSIALFLMLTSFLVLIFKSLSNRNILFPLPFLFLALFVYLGVGNIEALLDGTKYISKWLEIAALINTSEFGELFQSRLDVYSISITLFLDNYFFGSLRFDEVGKHSTILDIFSQFGIVVGAVLIYLLYTSIIVLFRGLIGQYKTEFVVFLYCVFMVGFFNTLVLETSVAFLFLASMNLIFQKTWENDFKQRVVSH
jgi:hypothetical protein